MTRNIKEAEEFLLTSADFTSASGLFLIRRKQVSYFLDSQEFQLCSGNIITLNCLSLTIIVISIVRLNTQAMLPLFLREIKKE
jgi:hypothetical protein